MMNCFINDEYGNKYFKEVMVRDSNEEILNKLRNILDSIHPDRYLEISYNFSTAFSFLLNTFNNGFFLTDNSFNGLLTYHYSQKENKNLNVYHTSFKHKDIEKLNFNESFDLIYSSYGLTYETLFNSLDWITSLLKIDGLCFLELPAYWFFRDNLNDDEKSVLEYSRTSDKKWVFTEDITSKIKENCCEIAIFEQVNVTRILNRLSLLYLSSLTKLHKASTENNMPVLEISNIKENNIKLNSALLVFKKKSKTISKENLFTI